MGIFGKRKPFIDESVDDRTWLRNGHDRFDQGKSGSFGSPETMAAGGRQALQNGDLAAAVFYFGKAVDIAQTWSFMKAGERSLALDARVFDEYATALEAIRGQRPEADVVTDWNNENVIYVLPMMIDVARHWGSPAVLDAAIHRVINASVTTPRPDGSGTQRELIDKLLGSL